MGLHPIFQDITDTHRGANDHGLRPVSAILPTIIGDLFARMTSFEPRYFVRDGRIVSVTSGRSQTVLQAREALGHYVDDALETRHSDLVDIDIIHIAHLIRAIRAAEGKDPTPPAALAEAA
jgi:hypothetical protein